MTQTGNLKNQSTENALSILEYMISQPGSQKLSEIASNLKMNASTVLRYVNALQSCGYLQQDEKTFQYRATSKICRLANIFMSHFSLFDVAHPYVQAVSEHFGETACLSVEQDSAVFYTDIVVSSNRTLMNVQRIGCSAPLHSTAAGKLFLASYSPAQLEVYLKNVALTRYTDHTIISREALIKELDTIRAQGFSIDNEENEDGIICISYPILDHKNNTYACISITGPAFRLQELMEKEKHQLLADTARKLSAEVKSFGSFKY